MKNKKQTNKNHFCLSKIPKFVPKRKRKCALLTLVKANLTTHKEIYMEIINRHREIRKKINIKMPIKNYRGFLL